MSDRPYEGSSYQGPYQGQYEGSYEAPGAAPEGTPYEGYDPYAQQYPQAHAQQHPQAYAQQQYPHAGPEAQPQSQQQAWPGQQQAYDDPHAAQQYTQQWQGQTWETQTHAHTTHAPRPGPAAETAYPTPLSHREPAGAYGAQAAAGHGAVPTAPAAPYAPPVPDQTSNPAANAAPGPAGRPAPHAGPASAPAPADPAGGEPGYGPATLVGNARVTDAQRARAEGRSPIIEPGMQPAALTALLGLLLAGTAQIGTYALLVPLVLLQAVTAAGWFRLNGMWPARQGIALGFAGALAADAAVLGAGRENAPAAILGTLGVWVLLSLALQLRSHADPDERMYGLMATVASAALSIIATGYLAAGADAVTVGAAAVAVAVLARALPLPTAASVVVSVLAAAGAGIAAGGMTGLGAKGALLGAGAAVCALIGHRVASYDYPSRFVHFTAGVALPLSAAAPLVWVLGRALG
ncbi:hypothetical protein ACH4UM_21050 [Streptomyces sp. NPDC020801]|uniref:hypothetical protein n=1 Tax=unclassified Streptomyces TaxID=2593676 RepID=UPI0037AB79D6